MADTKQQEKKKPGLLARRVPVLDWLPHYNKAWLSGDIVAGLSVWALMVPQCLGFAAICGVPVQYGLYAAAVALIVYAFFASSRHVVTGGLPVPALPDVSLITENFGLILSGAIGVLLVGFSESLAAARQYASKYHYDIDINQEGDDWRDRAGDDGVDRHGKRQLSRSRGLRYAKRDCK
jgi:MFS superfamily sulfate permease-like transporter